MIASTTPHSSCNFVYPYKYQVAWPLGSLPIQFVSATNLSSFPTPHCILPKRHLIVMIYRMLLVILTLGFAVSYCASAVVKGPSPPRPATLYASVPLNDSIPIAFTAKNEEWSRISAAVLKCSGLTELYYGRQLETSNLDLIIGQYRNSEPTLHPNSHRQLINDLQLSHLRVLPLPANLPSYLPCNHF